MARIKLTLTEEHIALLKNIRFGELFISHPEKDLSNNVKAIRKSLIKVNEAVAEHDDPNWRVRVNEERDYMPFTVDTYDIEENLDKIEKASELSKHYAEVDDKRYFAADTYDLFGGNTIELVARMIGVYDKVIEGTEEDFDGPKFPPDVIDHIVELLNFIINNFTNIEELIHQRVFRGGVEPNVTYVAYDYEHLWFTEEEFEEHRKKKK